MRTLTTSSAGALVVAAAMALSSCGTADADGAPDAAPGHVAGQWDPLPRGAAFDYQIGGAYSPGDDVRVVIRDRHDAPDPDRYSVCYVNAFQTQPAQTSWWQTNHDDLLLRDAGGAYVVDGEWDEILLDLSSADKRAAVTAVVAPWIEGCATAGYNAVEPDNLDSWTRSAGMLTSDDAMAFVAGLAGVAHDHGLAIAQKNAAEVAEEGRAAGLDFAVAEECGRWDECDAYSDAYDGRVVVVEYSREDFGRACARWGSDLAIVLRDRGVTPPPVPEHVSERC